MISQDQLYSFIGEQLKNHRETQDRKQQDVADAIGLERTSITNIERGKQKLPIHVLFNICEVLGVSPTEVLPRMEAVTEEREMAKVSVRGFEGELPPGIAQLISGVPR